MTHVLSSRSAFPRTATAGHFPLVLQMSYAQPLVAGFVRILLFLSAFWLLAMAFAPTVWADEVFIPVIQHGASGVAGSDGNPPCQLSETEQAVAAILVSHPDQRREQMLCDPILTRVARERAMDMAKRDYFDHVNPDGYGPNYLVRAAGYDLPILYGDDPRVNMVESIAAGFGLHTGQDVWVLWEGSEVHRTHLLGRVSFMAEQERYGIGHVRVEGSTYTNYWVFIAAHPPD